MNARARLSCGTGFKDVAKEYGKYVARFMENCKRYHLGKWTTPEEAALSYARCAARARSQFVTLSLLYVHVHVHVHLPFTLLHVSRTVSKSYLGSLRWRAAAAPRSILCSGPEQ